MADETRNKYVLLKEDYKDILRQVDEKKRENSQLLAQLKGIDSKFEVQKLDIVNEIESLKK